MVLMLPQSAAEGTPSRNRSDSYGEIAIVPRAEFVRAFGETYQPGQHVTMLGPTQRGKTTLALQLLQASCSPEHQCVILAGKPPGRDHTMSKAARQLNLRIVEEWPPDWRYGDRKRNGYVLRPRQSMKNLDADNLNLKIQFRRAMMANYASKKPVITVVDEAHHVQNDLKLKAEYEAPLMRGAPVNAEWSLIQRGRFMSYQAYDAPEHIFMFYDPDQNNQRRYAEIGGVDPRYIAAIVSQLQTSRAKTGGTISECLYIKRSGPELCIVDVT